MPTPSATDWSLAWQRCTSGMTASNFSDFLFIREPWNPFKISLVTMPFFNKDFPIEFPLLGTQSQNFALLISNRIEYSAELNTEFVK